MSTDNLEIIDLEIIEFHHTFINDRPIPLVAKVRYMNTGETENLTLLEIKECKEFELGFRFHIGEIKESSTVTARIFDSKFVAEDGEGSDKDNPWDIKALIIDCLEYIQKNGWDSLAIVPTEYSKDITELIRRIDMWDLVFSLRSNTERRFSMMNNAHEEMQNDSTKTK